MGAFSRSWSLFKSTWQVLMADKELMVFPFLAGLVALVTSVTIFGVGFAVLSMNPALADSLANAAQSMDNGDASPVTTVGFILLLFVYYLIMAFIANYFMTGLAGAALMRFEGGDPTFGDGIRIANSRLGVIFGFSAVAATVGVLLSLLRNRNSDGGNATGRILAALGGTAWNIATFLVIPVIAAQTINPIDAIKKSASMLRHTWGEQLVGATGIGFIFGIVTLLVVVLFGGLTVLAASATGSMALSITVIVLGIIVVALLAVINNTLGSIYKAAVYHYAETGEVAKQYTPELISTAFRAKGSPA
jgi:hypothetical protein